ncbi:MAG: glycosyltransferase family 32 protein [Paracoccaceae bacterium]
MMDKATFKARLAEARGLMPTDPARARHLLDAIRDDQRSAVLGEMTALGLPRKLHAAYLKLAKVQSDDVTRVGLQYHLVPDPALLASLAQTTAPERQALANANRQPVPRALHQIWIGPRPVPVTVPAWAAHADRHGYTHRLWREADLREIGAETNPVFTAMMARSDYPGAVDVARYLILEATGGIYLDCDWYPAREDIAFHDHLPLVGLTVLAEDTPRDTGIGGLLLSNAFIAAPPRHPAFARLLAALPQALTLLPDAPAWWSTGPLIFTLVCRGGSVTVADARLVAGKALDGSTSDDVAELCSEIASQDGGLLLAWKPWG